MPPTPGIEEIKDDYRHREGYREFTPSPQWKPENYSKKQEVREQDYSGVNPPPFNPKNRRDHSEQDQRVGEGITQGGRRAGVLVGTYPREVEHEANGREEEYREVEEVEHQRNGPWE